jgi:hypothetical protein
MDDEQIALALRELLLCLLDCGFEKVAVVKQHAGSIEVDTQPGEFTEIRIILPRSAVHVSAERA